MELLFISTAFWLMNCQFVNALPDEPATLEKSDEDRHLQNIYKKMDTGLKVLVEKSVNMSEFVSAGGTVNLSTNCLENFLKIKAGVRKLESWAMSFLDASGKLPDGLMSGNSYMLGNYDQCLSSSSEMQIGEVGYFGKYCLITFEPFLPDPQQTPYLKDRLTKIYNSTRNVSDFLRWQLLNFEKMDKFFEMNYYGLCVPSTCSQKDVENLIKFVGERIFLNLDVQYCHAEEDTRKIEPRNIVIICIFIFVGLLGIMATTMDYYFRMKNLKFESAAIKLLLCFSIKRNFSKLVDTKTSPKDLPCLYGIRVLTTFYVIVGHKMATEYIFPVLTNAIPNVQNYSATFFFQIVANGFLCVDVFFFLGGLVNSYTMQNKMTNSDKSFSRWKFILHRLWRIYPCYVFTILLQLIMIPRSPLGVLLEETSIDRCTREWWKNILFINNFFGEKNVCLVHSWYIASDFQFFLVSLFTVPLLTSNPKRGILLNAMVIVCGLLFTALWVLIMHVPPTFLLENVYRESLVTVSNAYMAPFSHVAPYFLGILMGHILSTKGKIEIPKVYQAIGWIVASILFTSMLFMPFRWNSGTEYSVAESVLYFTFSKPLYALAVGWMVFCCATGHGGIINYILSFKIWIPLSRITFALYLISFPIQLFFLTNLKRPIDTQWMIMIWVYFGDLTICCLLSFVILLLLESPMFGIEHLTFNHNAEKKTEAT